MEFKLNGFCESQIRFAEDGVEHVEDTFYNLLWVLDSIDDVIKAVGIFQIIRNQIILLADILY